MSVQKTYPDYVLQKIKQLSQRFNISESTILQEFEEYYKTDFVQTDPQFKSDDDRYKYVLEVLTVRYKSQLPTIEVAVIPFGITDIRITPQGPISRIYAILQKRGESKAQVGVIVNRGQQANLVDEVQLFYLYKSVRLSQFSSDSNVFFSTQLTRFDDPQPFPDDPLSLLKKIGVVNLKIAETPYKLSKRIGEDSKYVDEFDLRGISGIVVRYNTGKRPSGTDWALYVISDDSVAEEQVTPEGYIVPSQLTVWVPRRFLKYDIDSKIYCVGTLSLSDRKEPFMNAIYVHPIIAKPLNL
jgi:hypothetical protein